jgi:phosphatidylserine decarboxylase
MSPSDLKLGDRLFVALQHLLPQHALSALMYRLARCTWRPFKNTLINWFVAQFRVDMGRAVEPDPTAYPSFNAFFTRALRPEARPLAAEPALLCPADGVMSRCGNIRRGTLIQAKGHDFTAASLLGDAATAALFADGTYATIYLSPRDYHRVHMPLAGTLTSMRHIPGRLFSVNAITARTVPGLFARNERVVCLFDTQAGPMALVLVGAIFVGSMETVLAGQVTPSRGAQPWRPDPGTQIHLDRGAEMGRFNMGSTVILLLPAGAQTWDPALQPGSPLRMGQALGTLSGRR